MDRHFSYANNGVNAHRALFFVFRDVHDVRDVKDKFIWTRVTGSGDDAVGEIDSGRQSSRFIRVAWPRTDTSKDVSCNVPNVLFSG